ncbi:MAG: hypothetical protein KJ850_03300 [Gammaproteobacteria bacterium]|nr:hypothetical protein [Gammaproteobacteria bacterium]MBU1624053.1 hypothetical protein [Gammaproteobacteria bacterium]MBU1981781.1 hypothetical protein [Gammaproteobacteria bacterium]
MSDIVIFCKSYHRDLERAVVMAESVRRYNREGLPLYISVPQCDLNLFQRRIGTQGINWLCDEDVIRANPSLDMQAYLALPGHISQQVVKAEFWRVNPAPNSVCIDSDSRFIRDFFASDFLAPDGTPYTILHEGKPFIEFCLTHGIRETERHFEALCEDMRKVFGRVGPSYAFNPFPVIWSRKVWQDLQVQLEEEGSDIMRAIVAHPYESSWYGEALLKHRSIPLLPKEPIFKAYLYFEEYERDKRDGMTEEMLARFYLGVVYQSNWYPHRLKFLKRIAYKLKRRMQRYRN